MRDWQALVEKRLAGLALEAEERSEVVAELAAHLRDMCEELRSQGLTDEQAAERALWQVGGWQALQRKILTAKRKEPLMKARIQQLWIPGFLTLIFSMLSVFVFLKAGFQPRLVSNGSNTVSLYLPWLSSLPFLGALGAYLSFRAGGSRGKMLSASVFPAVALTGAFLLMFPIGSAAERITGSDLAFPVVATTLLRDGIGWLLVPGAILVAGGLIAHLLLNKRPSSSSAAIV